MLSVYPSIHLSIYLCTSNPYLLSIHPPPIHHLYIYLYIYISTHILYLTIHPFVHPSIIYSPISISICTSIYLPTYPSIQAAFIHSYIHPSYLDLSIHPFVHPSIYHLSIQSPSIYPSIQSPSIQLSLSCGVCGATLFFFLNILWRNDRPALLFSSDSGCFVLSVEDHRPKQFMKNYK